MKICFVHKFIPVPVFYTERFIALGAATVTAGPFCCILMKPKYRDREDVGLLKHELRHVEQNWRSWFMHPIKYHYSDKYRLEAEAECYAVQLLEYADDRDRRRTLFIDYMLNKYRLPFSRETVAAALDRWIRHLSDA